MFFITFLSFYFIVYFLLGLIFSSNKETNKPIFDQNDKDEEELEKDVLNNSFKKTYYFTSYDDTEEDDIEDEEESYYSYEEDNEEEQEDTFLDHYMRSQWDITSYEYWVFGAGVEED